MLIGARLSFGLLTFVGAVVLIVGAVYLVRRREPKETDDIIRGSAVVAIAVVGLVFGLLLSHLETELISWVNFVTHYLPGAPALRP